MCIRDRFFLDASRGVDPLPPPPEEGLLDLLDPPILILPAELGVETLLDPGRTPLLDFEEW